MPDQSFGQSPPPQEGLELCIGTIVTSAATYLPHASYASNVAHGVTLEAAFARKGEPLILTRGVIDDRPVMYGINSFADGIFLKMAGAGWRPADSMRPRYFNQRGVWTLPDRALLRKLSPWLNFRFGIDDAPETANPFEAIFRDGPTTLQDLESDNAAEVVEQARKAMLVAVFYERIINHLDPVIPERLEDWEEEYRN